MRIGILLLLAGCASAPKAEPQSAPLMTTANGEVKLGDWCNLLSDEMCGALSKACFGGNNDVRAGCVDQSKITCLSGRDPQMGAGRTPAELNQCVASLHGLSCEGLGAGIGSGALSVCQARAAIGSP